MTYTVHLNAFYAACGVTPPNGENDADDKGTIEVKDGTDFANLCRRSGVSPSGPVILTFPDVCSVPQQPAAGPVPIPYPNIALTKFNEEVKKGGFPNVKIADSSKVSMYAKSSGDEAGAGNGGIISRNVGKPQFIMSGLNVKVEGKNVVRQMDIATNNHVKPSFR